MSSAIQHRYSHTLSPRLLQSTTNCWQAPEQTYLPVFSRAGTARNDHAAHLADIARLQGRGSAARGPCALPTLGTQGIGYQCERRNRGRRPNGPNSDYEGSIARRILHAPTATSVVRNFYRDSVALMQLSSPLHPGIR